MSIIYARCSIGAAGAVSSIVGTQISTITKETGAGNYSVTLATHANAFLFADVMFASNADSVAKTGLSGVSQVDKLTFDTQANATAGDFVIVVDSAGVSWAFAVNKAGTDPEPSSALWTAIAAGKKVHVDISLTTTADTVCAAIRAAFAGLSGIGTTITVGAATGAYFECTHVYRKPVTVPALYKENGAATPTSVTKTQTTLGVQTAIDPTNTTGELITFTTAHGYETGRLVALSINSGALPTGWSAGNYYVIADSTTAVSFAGSLADAEAGTKTTISDYGDAGKTISVTPVAPFGSAIARAEFTSTTLKADVQSITKLYFTCYDYTGAQINPANGSKMYLALHLALETESGAGL